MATAVQQRRGTDVQHDDGDGFTGLEGEITVDITNDTIRVHDNSTKGGHRLAKYSELSTVASPISPTDAGTDTTMFPLLSGDATGTLSAKTDADGLTYNASSKTLTTTNIVANHITGTVANATSASSANTIVTTTTGTGDNFLVMVDADANAAQNARVRGEVKWDVGTSNLTIDGTVVSDAITSHQTTVVNSTSQTASNFYGQRMIHTGGAVTYTFAETGSISGTDIGKSVVIVNAGTGDIDLDITTSKFFELVPSLDADYADSSSGGKTGTDAHKLVKGGVAEFIVTEANKIIIMGSGIQ